MMFPLHPVKVGVILYITVPCCDPTLVSCCALIMEEFPEVVAPVTSDVVALHVNVAPADADVS